MFYLMFIDHLAEKKVLTADQADKLSKSFNEVKVPIGVLAVKAGYLTLEQANLVNTEQSRTDKRFGEIVINKGFMDESTFRKLLNEQSNDVEIVTRAITEAGYMTKEEVSQQLTAYRNEHGLDEEQWRQIANNEVEAFVEFLCGFNNEPHLTYFSLFIKTVIRFIDRQVKIKLITEDIKDTVYTTKQICQGQESFTTGLFSINKDDATKVGFKYAKSLHIADEDIDADDALCELVNCINGLLISHFDKLDEDYTILVVENAKTNVLPQSKVIEIALPFAKIACFVSTTVSK